MVMEEMKCPYCGETILAEAKKCKHCGEWLSDEYAESQSDDGDGGGFLGKAISVILFLIIAFYTLPSDRDHLMRLKNATREAAVSNAYVVLEEEGSLVQALGQSILGTDALMDTFVSSQYSFKIINLKVISIGYIQDKETGEKQLGSIAAFGIVLPLVDFDD